LNGAKVLSNGTDALAKPVEADGGLRMNWSDTLIQLQYDLGAPQELSWLVEGITFFVGAFVLANAALVLALLLIWIDAQGGQPHPGSDRAESVGPLRAFSDCRRRCKTLVQRGYQTDDSRYPSYLLAPVLSVMGVLMALAVLPIGAGLIGTDSQHRRPLSGGARVARHHGGIDGGLGQQQQVRAALAGFRVVAQLLELRNPDGAGHAGPCALDWHHEHAGSGPGTVVLSGPGQPRGGLVRLFAARCLPHLLHRSVG
jgi:hypothetical protein